MRSLPLSSPKRKKRQVKVSLENSIEMPPVRRSQRTAPSLYRREMEQENSNASNESPKRKNRKK
jgi:hypothetical protein